MFDFGTKIEKSETDSKRRLFFFFFLRTPWFRDENRKNPRLILSENLFFILEYQTILFCSPLQNFFVGMPMFVRNSACSDEATLNYVHFFQTLQKKFILP